MSRSVVRGLDVLVFLVEAGEPASVQQIAAGSGMSRATAYRVVEELVQGGWATLIGPTKRVSLSLKVSMLGLESLRHNRVRDVLLPNAVELARLTSRPVLIAFYERGEAVYTDEVQVIGERVMPMARALRTPAACTAAGKILLALQEAAEVERVVAQGLPKLSKNTKTAPDEIRADIQCTRDRGYGVTCEEFGPGSRGIAFPVFDHAGKPAAALGVHTSEAPTDAAIAPLLPATRAIAARASAELGYRSLTRTAV